MATIVTRKGKRGVRYQVRIHRHGIHQSATFATRDAARTWAQMVEGYVWRLANKTASSCKQGMVWAHAHCE
jgi:hypothetical protein